MTLMPVSNIWALGSSWSNAGAARWISQRSSIPSILSVSSGWPSTLKTCPSTALPTGTEMPRPRLRPAPPRTSPSVCCMQMQRTRPSPICWATSAATVWVVPSSSMSNSTSKLISGSACGGNSTAIPGPAMATTRPSSSAPPVVPSALSAVVVMRSSSLRLAERLGSADDLHDLGGDGVLTGAVHDAGQGADELVRVLGGGGHGALLGGEERGRTLEQGGEDLRLQRPRGQLLQELRGLRLELGVALERPVPPVDRPGLLGQGQRQHLHALDALGAGGNEPGRHHLHQVDVAGDERCSHNGRYLAGVPELGPIGDAGERPCHVNAAVAQIGRRLLADSPHGHFGAGGPVLGCGALRQAQDARVVGAGQAPVPRDGQDPEVLRWPGRA